MIALPLRVKTLVPTVVSMPQCAEATAERDSVVHRAAAGIQHEGRAGDVPAAGKFVESSGALGRDDANRARPNRDNWAREGHPD